MLKGCVIEWNKNLLTYMQVLDKRRCRAEMAASTIAMLVSPKTRTKGGGHHVLLFLIYAFPFKIWSQM